MMFYLHTRSLFAVCAYMRSVYCLQALSKTCLTFCLDQGIGWRKKTGFSTRAKLRRMSMVLEVEKSDASAHSHQRQFSHHYLGKYVQFSLLQVEIPPPPAEIVERRQAYSHVHLRIETYKYIFAG